MYTLAAGNTLWNLAVACLEPIASTVTASSVGRIVHVTTAHGATDNRILHKECSHLAAQGFDVYLLASGDQDRTVRGVHVVALPLFGTRAKRLLRGGRCIWRHLTQLKPDVVHVHDPELLPVVLLWRRLARLDRRAHVVYDAHEDLPKQVYGKAYLPSLARPLAARVGHILERLADLRCDAIVVATPAIRTKYRNGRVTLVQNFPRAEEYPDPAPLREAPAVVCYVGAVAHGRGAVEMVAAVRASVSADRLVIAGPAESPELAAGLTLDAGVDYRGVLDPAQIPALLATSRLGLAVLHPLPNYLDAQSTKLFEYMAAGRPFLASDFPTWRALLGRFECGLFVDPRDVPAITQAIDTVLGDIEAASAMGRRGRAAFLDYFCFEPEGEQLVSLMRQLASDRSPPPSGR